MQNRFLVIALSSAMSLACLGSLIVSSLEASDCNYSQGPDNQACQGVETRCLGCSQGSDNCGAYLHYGGNPTRVCLQGGSQDTDRVQIWACKYTAACNSNYTGFWICTSPGGDPAPTDNCGPGPFPAYCYDCSQGTITVLPGEDCEAVTCPGS
jgi:hypothetical protein